MEWVVFQPCSLFFLFLFKKTPHARSRRVHTQKSETHTLTRLHRIFALSL